jgi:hypothetical protein
MLAAWETIKKFVLEKGRDFRQRRRRVVEEDSFDQLPSKSDAPLRFAEPQFEEPSGLAVQGKVQWYNPSKGLCAKIDPGPPHDPTSPGAFCGFKRTAHWPCPKSAIYPFGGRVPHRYGRESRRPARMLTALGRSCAGAGGGGVFSREHCGQTLVRHPDEGVHLAKFTPLARNWNFESMSLQRRVCEP